MILNDSFDDFKQKISLDDSRKQKIITAHNTVRDWLEGRPEILSRNPYTFLQGSYASFTAVKPQLNADKQGSFDVDVVLLMDLEQEKNDGDDVIDFVARSLTQHGTYKDKIIKMKHCVRLNYADEFHLDITPANRVSDNDNPIEVANTWHISHPKGLIQYCTDCNGNSGDYFYSVVRLLKWWRNLRYGDEGSPKSIILVTLVGMFIPTESDSLEEAFVSTLENVCSFFNENENVPELVNPTLDKEAYDKEIISQSWAWGDYYNFKFELKNALTQAKEAIECEDEEDTINFWNSDNLFMDTFPKKIRGLGKEAKAFAEAVDTQKLVVAPSGIITIGGAGKLIPHTRQYGDTKTEK